MSKLQPVRGTHDLLPADAQKHQEIIEQARDVTRRFGFWEAQTPIFEFTEVFARTLGDASDIVNKEMYTFEDRGGESLTLRPEGTAGIARAFISHGMQRQLPLKFFYQGPIFRYERPQKGRQRQFHQIGAELLGSDSPQADIEVISMAHMFLHQLGLKKNPQLVINTIGDKESRDSYRGQLVDYYESHKSSLSEDSLKRLELNPLRILDSKDEADKKLNLNAPAFSDSLNAKSQEFFATVLDGLKSLGIVPQVDEKLVRGLDYYCHTVFEFKSDQLGAQDTVLAGGRYDGLIELMGGPSTPATGWAAGLERLALLGNEPEMVIPELVAVIPQNESAQSEAVKLAYDLRSQGFNVEMSFSGNMKKRMQKAHKMGAQFAVILGEEEIKNHSVALKNFATGDQSPCTQSELVEKLKSQFKSEI